MRKLPLIAALLSLAGTAGYAANNVDYVATNTPSFANSGASDAEDADNGNAAATVWAGATDSNTGGFAGAFYNSTAPGWDIYSGNDSDGGGFNNNGAYADMFTTLQGGALTAGQTLSIQIQLSSLDQDGQQAAGFDLVNTSGYVDQLSVYMRGGDGNWQYNNGNAYSGGEAAYQSSGLIGGTYLSTTYNHQTYDTFTITILDNSGDYSATFGGASWTGTLASTVNAIRIFNNDGGDSSDVVTNNLQVSTAAVPEPSSIMMMLSSGVLGSLYLLRRKRA